VTEHSMLRWVLHHGEFAESSRARHEFTAYLRLRMDPEVSDIDAAEVIFGELVANALEHGRGDVTVDLCRRGIDTVLRVHDEGSGFSLETEPPEVEKLRGRGLRFVHTLARRVVLSESGAISTVEALLPVRLRVVP
jgi:two-component sensor histidine kinase